MEQRDLRLFNVDPTKKMDSGLLKYLTQKRPPDASGRNKRNLVTQNVTRL